MFIIKKVLILFGGNSSEHYISCKSCASVVKNIDKEKYDYEVVGISKENTWYKFSDDISYLENGNWQKANILEIDNIINYINLFIVRGHKANLPFVAAYGELFCLAFHQRL